MAEITAHNVPKINIHKKPHKGDSFVSFGHQHWNLVLNMMLGIQMAVKSTLETQQPLNKRDFALKYVFELVPRRTNDENVGYKICRFFDYAPAVFNEIRKMYGIKNDDYLRSIGPEPMLNNLIRGNLKSLAELTSAGKSGSFFYYSADGKYTMKTVSREEFHFLKNILRNYYNHLVHNTNSLIIKFFGCHKLRFVKGESRKNTYFVIMSNIFNTIKEIHTRYDLKGSTHGRKTNSSYFY